MDLIDAVLLVIFAYVAFEQLRIKRQLNAIGKCSYEARQFSRAIHKRLRYSTPLTKEEVLNKEMHDRLNDLEFDDGLDEELLKPGRTI